MLTRIVETAASAWSANGKRTWADWDAIAIAQFLEPFAPKDDHETASTPRLEERIAIDEIETGDVLFMADVLEESASVMEYKGFHASAQRARGLVKMLLETLEENVYFTRGAS